MITREIIAQWLTERGMYLEGAGCNFERREYLELYDLLVHPERAHNDTLYYACFDVREMLECKQIVLSCEELTLLSDSITSMRDKRNAEYAEKQRNSKW